MMRLQRVGRRNDPSYRIVVTDKRTGPKSDKHVARLGSYNPKMDHVQLDKDEAKKWLGQGVQPSDTVYNILVGQGVVEGRKKNVLPKKSPIIDEEALAKAKEEEEAKAAAEAEAANVDTEASEETPAEEVTEEAPVADSSETTSEEVASEKKTEEPATDSSETDSSEAASEEAAAEESEDKKEE